jgi:uncharacterized protein YraI
MKKILFTIILSGLLLLSACGPASSGQSVDTTATKMAGDFYATQTAFANQAYWKEMANATATKMAGDFFATQTQMAYQAMVAATATSQSTSHSQAVVNIESMNVRSGPGTAYPIQTYAVRGDKLIILGQAYDCGWLEVSMPDGQTGWVSATYVTFTLACSAITLASIPPMPTKAAQSQSGNNNNPPPATPPSSCDPSGSIDISNTTGGSVTLYLSGPASYTYYLGTGDTTLYVCPGTYDYTAYGCGGASDTGSMSTGEAHEFYCV